MTTLESFMEEVRAERDHQADKWGDGSEASLDATDDKMNSAESFTAFIAHHSSRWFPGGFPPHGALTLAAFRSQMVKVAALAYAAARWADRRMAEIDSTVEEPTQAKGRGNPTPP